MEIFSLFDSNYKWLEKNTILITRAGSHSYGTNRPDSDEDYRGIALGRPIDYLGFKDPFKQYSLKVPDLTILEFKKIMKLLIENNPNVLEMLWIDPKDIILQTEFGKELISKRDLFLSKQCKERYLGYARSQMHRISTHRKWLLNPPSSAPNRKDYDLPNHLSIPTEQWEAVNAQIRSVLATWNPDWEPFSEAQKIWLDRKLGDMLTEMEIVSSNTWELAARKLGYSENFILLLNKEKQFEAAQSQWESYCDWKKNRNPKRAGMEAKIGYDCYSDDTEFLTEDGYKLYDQITSEDKLATFDKNSFHLEYQKFTGRFDSIYNGNMYNFYGNHLDMLVTYNHNMFIREFSRKLNYIKGDWNLLHAENLPDCFDIIQSITPCKKHYKNQSELSNIPGGISKKDYLKLMGWYLSYGTAVFRKNKSGPVLKEIRISQKEFGKLYQQMNYFAKKYNCKLYKCQHKNNAKTNECTLVIPVAHKFVTKLVNECGTLKNKHIPKYIFGAVAQDIDILIDALIGGDGTKRKHKTKNTLIYYSSLPQLANDVQRLGIMCGYLTSLYGPYVYPYTSPISGKSTRTIYQVFINKHESQTKRIVRNSNVKKENVINKRVVCFSVPNSTLITRRNGHVAFQGNCKHMCHCIRLLIQNVEILEEKTIHVYRKDANYLLSILNGDHTFDSLIKTKDELETKIKLAYDKSTLQKYPQVDLIEDFMLFTLKKHINAS